MAGGTTTSAVNPLQTRNTVNNGSTTANANPTSLYGDLVSQYLTNIKTEYDPATHNPVTYYKGGDTTGTGDLDQEAPGAVRHRLQGQGGR